MLFMDRENKVIEYFAAGNSGVIPQYRMDKPCTVFESGIAAHDKSHGFYTVVGAANILRNGSHSGNLSASTAVVEDCADIICSDYYPAAILAGVFQMNINYKIPLPQMVNRATLNPAKAMKIDRDYGSIEQGKKADVLIIDILDGYPVITHVFVDGVAVSRIEYRR